MNRGTASCFVCPQCGASGLSLEAFVADGDSVKEGRLSCRGCANWYRIEHGVTDLLPLRMRCQEHYKTFAAKHNLAWKEPAREVLEHGKSSQIEHFHENADEYEVEVVNSPYYKALDRITFMDWMQKKLKAGDLVLDLGCGTGRQCIPFAQKGLRTVGVDISEEMLILGQKKIDEMGLSGQVDLVNGDAENPPVKDASFNACIIYGVLHHLPDKQATILNASKKMRKDGLFYSLDPHDSPVRFIFDMMMRVWKLYDEEASDDPLLREQELTQWLSNAGIKATTRLSTYLPPHLHHFFSLGANVKLLSLTDSFFNRIPPLRKCAGIIVSEGVKVD